MGREIFLGIGCGPIQTGIFVSGAHAAGFKKIVIAEVNAELVKSIRESGSITINVSSSNSIKAVTFDRVEIYNPMDETDLKKLIEYAKDADVLNTALPSTKFYGSCASWLKVGFDQNPNKTRYFYTSENTITGAKELKEAINKEYPNTYYLDTVIGKMSRIFDANELDAPVLSKGCLKGHLVEEFNTIYSSDAPGISESAPNGVYAKSNLEPFEEAKLYGHNASHFALGLALSKLGCKYMSEGRDYPELLSEIRQCLVEECGESLCKKYAKFDDYFDKVNFTSWAEELIKRMTSPYLTDSVDRIIRDLDRKLSYEDRSIGAIRLCLSQGVEPSILRKYAKYAAIKRTFDELLGNSSTPWETIIGDC